MTDRVKQLEEELRIWKALAECPRCGHPLDSLPVDGYFETRNALEAHMKLHRISRDRWVPWPVRVVAGFFWWWR